MAARRGPKPRVIYEDKVYTCRSYKVEIPDLAAMERTDVLFWLLRNTVPTGYSKAPSGLEGFGGAITVESG